MGNILLMRVYNYRPIAQIERRLGQVLEGAPQPEGACWEEHPQRYLVSFHFLTHSPLNSSCLVHWVLSRGPLHMVSFLRWENDTFRQKECKNRGIPILQRGPRRLKRTKSTRGETLLKKKERVWGRESDKLAGPWPHYLTQGRVVNATRERASFLVVLCSVLTYWGCFDLLLLLYLNLITQSSTSTVEQKSHH